MDTVAAYRQRRDARRKKIYDEKMATIGAYYVCRDRRLAERGLPPAKKLFPDAVAIYANFHLTHGKTKDRIFLETNNHCDGSVDECRAKNRMMCRVHGERHRKQISTGRNKFTSGFTSSNSRVHWRRHGHDYPNMTESDYAKEALRLIQLPCGGDIRGYALETGQIVRYNRITTDFVVGNNNSNSDIPYGIASMYKMDEQRFDRLLKEEAFGDDYY